jgi:hypothetical protein
MLKILQGFRSSFLRLCTSKYQDEGEEPVPTVDKFLLSLIWVQSWWSCHARLLLALVNMRNDLPLKGSKNQNLMDRSVHPCKSNMQALQTSTQIPTRLVISRCSNDNLEFLTQNCSTFHSDTKLQTLEWFWGKSIEQCIQMKRFIDILHYQEHFLNASLQKRAESLSFTQDLDKPANLSKRLQCIFLISQNMHPSCTTYAVICLKCSLYVSLVLHSLMLMHVPSNICTAQCAKVACNAIDAW